MADPNSGSMETDAPKSTQEFSEEIWSGLDNNAIASLYQQLEYVNENQYARLIDYVVISLGVSW